MSEGNGDSINVSEESFKEAYDVVAGIVSTLGIAISTRDKRTIKNVMDDLKRVVQANPEAGFDLFQVTLMMCARNSLELFLMEEQYGSRRNKKKEN